MHAAVRLRSHHNVSARPHHQATTTMLELRNSFIREELSSASFHLGIIYATPGYCTY
jgi:hypothetical protein